ncbi:type IV pilin-like G/H family protein [Trichothermofontia sp.]
MYMSTETTHLTLQLPPQHSQPIPPPKQFQRQGLKPQRRYEAGFTLIELMVVILIVTILSAIAIPSFLNQANKAKQSEAKTHINTFVRAQQAYYLEQQTFAPSLELLVIGIPSQTHHYQYVAAGPYNAAAANEHIVVFGNTLQSPLKGYVGMVQVGMITAIGEATTLAVLCENNLPGLGSVPVPTTTISGPSCSPGTAPIK